MKWLMLHKTKLFHHMLRTTLKKQFNDFLNSLDVVNDCKDYKELKSKGNHLKLYLENISEQIDDLIFSYSPKMTDYLLDATKKMLSDEYDLDNVLDDIAWKPSLDTMFNNLKEYNDNDKDLSDWGFYIQEFWILFCSIG